MKTYAEKTPDTNQATAASSAPLQSAGDQVLQYADNRLHVSAPFQLQSGVNNNTPKSTYQNLADNSSQVVQLRAFQHMADAGPQAKDAARVQAMASKQSAPVVQRTKYKYDGTKWNVTSTSTTDKDTFPVPAPGLHALDDEYDQETGVYTSPIKDALTSMGQSSGSMGFYDRRSATGYKYASGKNQQGPHTLAHITKRVGMAAGVQAGRDPLKLRGSSAFPRPRRMNKMLRDRLSARGPNWKKDTRTLRTQYLRTYKKHYLNADKNASAAKKLQALRAGIELNPATVYNIGTGTTTAAQIAGKSENRTKGAADWSQLLDTSGAITDTTGLHTIDFSGASQIEKDEALRMAAATRDWLRSGQADEDSGDSESDSEMELDV